MQCKIKKITKYNVEGYDITINVSLEELETLQAVLRLRNGYEMKDYEPFNVILDTIDKELNNGKN